MSTLAHKEELFFILSATMGKEEALKETERIANNFSPKPSTLKPIIGSDTYKYYIQKYIENGWNSYWESRIFKYVNGKWETFMRWDSSGFIQAEETVKRSELGGNTVIEN